MAYHKTMKAEEQASFAGRVKRFRGEHAASQRLLAAVLKINAATVGRLERGEYAPFPQTIRRFEAFAAKMELAEQQERVESDGGKLEGFILREDLKG